MMKKQGITITMLVITVLILIIIASTISISVYSSINYSRISTWVNEITYIQDVVDEQSDMTSMFSDDSQTISIDVSNLSTVQIEEQFSGETITATNIVKLTILDLYKIGITNTTYGNLETDTDMYAVSTTTGRVYYVQGIEIDDAVYYTLTNSLRQRYDITSTNSNVTSVVFVPSKLGYSNSPIKLTVKVPINFSNIAISTSNNEINIGSQVTKEKTYDYEINSNEIAGNYIVTVSYNDGTQTLTSKYEVNGYDVTAPVIAPITNANFIYKKTETSVIDYITNITAMDDSGIKIIKYEIGKIDESQAQEYFKENGKVVVDGKINLDKGVTEYTIYVEDNAGNSAILLLDLTMQSYAIYSSIDNSLTFVKTDRKLSKGGIYNNKEITEVYTGFEETTYTAAAQVPWYNYRTNITSVSMEGTLNPISTAYWFYGFNNCSKLNLTNLDTSNVTTMRSMFENTGYDVAELEIIGTDNWDTSNVTTMLGVFHQTGRNAEIVDIGDLSKWNTSKVTEMYRMFRALGREKATTIDLGDLNTKEVTKADGTTYTAWDTSQVTGMGEMFNTTGWHVDEFNIGKLDDWDTSKVNNMSYMFLYAGASDTTWSIGDLSKWNTTNVTNMEGMFQGAGQNVNIFILGNLSTKEVTKGDGTKYTAWDTSKVKNMRNMFYQSGWNASQWNVGDLSGWNTTNVTNMEGMFAHIGASVTDEIGFTLGDLSKWNTSKVTDMSAMFDDTARKATWYLNLSGWNVSLVTDYENFNTSGTEKITLPNFK